PLALTGNDYIFSGQKLPAISASASKDSAGVIHISLVNIDPDHAQKIDINLGEEKVKNISARILTSKKLQDYNSFTEPEKIKPAAFKELALNRNIITINLPPTAVIVITAK
ncbi:MAG: alpha-N-arabinofuranosidase, partial [Methylotenera sp.]|nr:alpha-N-arabinofuranosidase [Flavobacterium sp.]